MLSAKSSAGFVQFSRKFTISMQVPRAHDVTKANGFWDKVECRSVEQKCAFLNEFWLLYSTTWSKLTFTFWMLKVHPILTQFYFLHAFSKTFSSNCNREMKRLTCWHLKIWKSNRDWSPRWGRISTVCWYHSYRTLSYVDHVNNNRFEMPLRYASRLLLVPHLKLCKYKGANIIKLHKKIIKGN